MEQRNDNHIYDRAKIGKLSGGIGILVNGILALGKMIAGGLSGSMAIMADGLNNLSDTASSVVTLLGFKFAEKPADKKHPYGHARYEYLASLTVAMLILVIGFELAQSSFEKILSPSEVNYSGYTIILLAVSVAVKLILMLFYRTMGRKIQSSALLATAADCRNDVITTTAVLVSALIESITELKIDGVVGLLVSLFILYSGISMAREIISPLLGEAADPQLQKQLTEYVASCPMVIGCHDLMVHDYGPGRRYASIHVEMDKGVDPLSCHDIIDDIERACMHIFGVHLVVHYDPVTVDDPETQRLKNLVETILKVMDPRLELHDFRMISKKDGKELMFDVILPDDLQSQKQHIKEILDTALKQLDPGQYTLNITFDL